ncbi:glycosyltransferase family 2 protein [Pedobacter jeongneungensis]|uniref:glycosyltransferase family 2 protein n=1 Tax=Pedobacter jeongneungensis TaxID=947309 RepID=UPI000469FDEA|nr:glycosyltransferase family 2 protein [Pedobacter jeongneungensis]
MKDKPTIALCIPAYNAANYLPRLLKLAHDQTIPFHEILVYNDCSTDNTEEIARALGATIINGDVNRGCSTGKNRLAEITTADWIHFHDADDELLPNFTAEMQHWLTNNHNDFKVLILNFNYINFDSKQQLDTANHNREEMRQNSLKYAIEHKIVNFGLYERLSFLEAGGFDTDRNVLYNEDKAFHIRLAAHGLKFDYLDTITCINYQYQQSMSVSNQLKCAEASYYVLKKTADQFGDIYPIELSDMLLQAATTLAAVNDWPYVSKAVKLAKQLNKNLKLSGGRLFRVLGMLDTYAAFWLREKLIRLFKPALRKSNG